MIKKKINEKTQLITENYSFLGSMRSQLEAKVNDLVEANTTRSQQNYANVSTRYL